MARAVCSSALLSAAAPVAPFLRTYRLGCVLVFNASAVSRGRSPGYCFPQPGPQLPSRFDSLPTHARTVLPAALASVSFGFVLVRFLVCYVITGEALNNRFLLVPNPDGLAVCTA
jgi:hypothetical protein